MANWQQNKSIAYKEYVPQNPIDLMTQVGVQKEGELQLGIQKVNSYFSQIAGLDVARDVDKQHIEQRLGDLKQGITKNLSGDFSDQRIINQIGGAASTIYKDPTVQNAVINTAAVRKESANSEELKKAGKGSMANEWDLNKDIQSYISSTEPRAQFRGKARAYSDFNKRALEGFKALTADETITDEAFVKNADGSFKVENGNFVLADTTIRKKLAGVTPERVQGMLMTYLTPEDWQQIATDGRYNYSNKSDEQFAVDLQKGYKERRDVTVNYLNQLESAKSSVKDPSEVAKLDQEIAGEKNRLSKLEKDYNNVTMSGDIEQAKAQKATLDYIYGFSNTFANKQTSQTYAGETPQKMMQWREEQKWDRQKFQATNAIALERLQLERNKDQREQKKDEEAAKLTSGGGLLSPKNQADIPVVTESSVEEKIAASSAFLAERKAAFIAGNKSQIPAGMNENEWYNQQVQQWALNPNNTSLATKAYFETQMPDGGTLADAERNVGASQQALQNARKLADDQNLNTASLIPKLAPVTLTFNGKESYTYTPKEFVEAIPKFAKYKTTYEGSPRVDVNYEKAKLDRDNGILTPKEYALFEQHEKGNKVVKEYVNNYTKAVLQPNQILMQQRANVINTSLQNAFTSNREGIIDIPTVTPEQKDAAKAKLNQFITFSGEKGTIANSPKFNKATAEQLLSLPDANYQIVANDGGEFDKENYKLIVRGTVDKKPLSVEINVTPEQKTTVWGNTAFIDPQTKQFNSTYGRQIFKAGGNSTNMNGKSYLFTKDFPQLSSYGVLGDVIQVSPNKYYFSLKVRDPLDNTFKQVEWPQTGPVSGAGIMDAKRVLTDEVIFSLLYPNTPLTPEIMKQIQQSAKKPVF